jgi:hypothetical protein
MIVLDERHLSAYSFIELTLIEALVKEAPIIPEDARFKQDYVWNSEGYSIH